MLQLGRLLDLTTDAHGLCRRRRRWGRFRQTTDDSTHDATGHTALDTEVLVEVGVDRHFGLDLLGRLGGRCIRIHDLHRLRRFHLWRWRRRRRRGRRRRCDERHHRRRRRQDIGRHQRNDDDEGDDQRFEENREADRLALVASQLDGRVDDVAKNAFITWQGSTSSLKRLS